MAWLGIELALGALALLRASREDAALAAELRLWPALVGAPPALSELAGTQPRARRLFLVGSFFYAFAMLQALGLLVSPDVTLDNVRAICGVPSAATRDCFAANATGELFGQLVIWPVTFIVSIWLGRYFEKRARVLTRDTAAAAMARDDVTPAILFLRAFTNDQVLLEPAKPSPMRWLIGRTRQEHYLDHMLVEEFSAYGPTFALGRPQEDVPPFGVWRKYMREATTQQWQAEIADRAKVARTIVMVADEGQGVAWELEHLGQAGHLHKTLFLAPRSRAEKSVNLHLWQTVAAASRFDLGADLQKLDAPVLGVFTPREQDARIATSASFTANDYLATVRWFFRDIIGAPSSQPAALKPS